MMTQRIRRRAFCVPAFLMVIGLLAGCGELAIDNHFDIQGEVVIEPAPAPAPVSLCASDGLGSTVFTPVGGTDLAMLFAAVEVAFTPNDQQGEYYFATADNVSMP